MITGKASGGQISIILYLATQLTGCIVELPTAVDMADFSVVTEVPLDFQTPFDSTVADPDMADAEPPFQDASVEADAGEALQPDLSYVGQCTPGETRSCGTEFGRCQNDTQVCNQRAQWPAPCPPPPPPTAEICDGQDNDCDGNTDETFELGAACHRQDTNGLQYRGQTRCNLEPGSPDYHQAYCGPMDDCSADVDGDGSTICNDCDDSDGNNAPGLREVCDGADNDCDGRVDENLARPCGGFDCEFQDGQQSCTDGQWSRCINDADGQACECLPGYGFDETIGRCRDINECETMESPCEGTCQNIGGSFRCHCADGQILAEDGRSCVGSYCEPAAHLALNGNPLNIAPELFRLCDQDAACCQSCDWLTQCQITQRRCDAINTVMDEGRLSQEAARQFHLFQCLIRCNGNDFALDDRVHRADVELRTLCEAPQCDDVHHHYMTMPGDNRQTCNLPQ